MKKTVELALLSVVISVAVICAVSEDGLRAMDGARAGETEKTSWASSPSFLGKNSLYADMEKVNGRYVITRIGNKPLMFRLNDLEPRFDTLDYPCTRYGGKFATSVTRPEKCKDDGKTFRKVKIDFQRTLAGDFLTIGRNILTGEFETYSGFDTYDYESAIAEALNQSGLDREKVINLYDEFLVSVQEQRAKAANEYARIFKEGIAVEFPMAVEDRSGLYGNDLSARDLVSLQENVVPTVEGKTIVFNKVDTLSIKNTLNGMREKYASEVNQLTSYYILKKANRAKDYGIRVEAPDKIFREGGRKQTVPLKVIVLSKTERDVSPSYKNENADLRIEDNRKEIRFYNKTGQFIRIEGLFSQYGTKITNTQLNMDLAPGAFIALDRWDGRLQLPTRETYWNATMDSLKGQTLSFGYGVQYKMNGQQASQSLQKVETYPLCDLLRNSPASSSPDLKKI